MAPTAIFAVLAVALVAGVNAGAPRKTVNGIPATYGEFPYQVSLRVKGKHYCGGAIVSRRHILTTAYCVVGISGLTVVTGTLSTTSAGEVHNVTDIVYHKLYEPIEATSPYDIAVIRVNDDIVFNAVQNKIDLATAPVPSGLMTIASGWGFMSTSPMMVTPKLNKIELSTISREQCQYMYAPTIEINWNQICTYSGPGVCAIDSGGPLVYNDELVGLMSYGIPCDLGAPDVFTSIYHLQSWVNTIISSE